MKKNKITLKLLLMMVCLLIINQMTAQSIVTQNIGSTGFVSKQADVERLNWDVGEVISGKTSGQDYLNQGLYHHFDIALFNKRPDADAHLFTAYPSPTNGIVKINATQKIAINIVGSDGRPVEQLTIGRNEFQTNINHLPDGTYFFVAQSDKKTVKAIKIILIK